MIYVIGSAFVGLLLYASIIDIRTRTISNIICVLILLLAVFRFLIMCFSPLFLLLGLLAGGVPLLVVKLIKPDSIGGGDVKLSAVCGALLGFNGSFLMLIVYCLLFLLTASFLRLTNRIKKGSSLPLAPFIAVSGLIIYVLEVI